MIPKDTIGLIFETARIEEVVSDFISLRRSGANLIGICPFHKEKTPSFMVSPAKGIFKCFGCGKAGNAVTFVMEHEHYTYPEALRYVAKKYGIEIKEKEQTPEEILVQNEREAMFNLNSFAQHYFTDLLHNDVNGQAIGLNYFRERDFRDQIIEKFQLGYCLDQRDGFVQHALANGYSKELLVKVGLATEYNGNLYDRFQGRVIFPIHNITGKVIGFGGRILTSDKTKAKYLNSPESEIYNKSKTLYGIFFAKNEISRLDNCILVEGYADVLSMHQAGITNAVASSGTSLTTEQIKMISRYTKNVTVLYDGDSAGIKAALRGTNMILAEGLNVRIVVLPPDEDPDSFVRHNPIEEVERYLKEEAKDFIRFKTELLLKDSGNDPIKRSEVTRDIIETIAVVPDAILRENYVKECSRMLDIAETTLLNEMNRHLRSRLRKEAGVDTNVIPDTPVHDTTQTEKIETNSGFNQERELVRLLFNYGHESIEFFEKNEQGEDVSCCYSVASLIVVDLVSDNFHFREPLYSRIFDYYDQALNENRVPNISEFVNNEDKDISTLAADLLSNSYNLGNWRKHEIIVLQEKDKLKDVVFESVLRYKSIMIDLRREEKQRELHDEQDPDNQLILLSEIAKLDKLKKELNEKQGIVVIK